MKISRDLPSRIIQIVLVTTIILLPIATTVAETDLNDNLELTGELLISDENGGITFAGRDRQTVAPMPSWHQSLTNDRFVEVLSNTSVLDHETGLVWQKATNEEIYTWYEAQVYCYKLANGGRHGWRLPTITELATLIDRNQTSQPKLPDNHPFTNVKSYYWSATDNDSDIYALRAVFNFGTITKRDKTEEYSVRAVRAGR